MQSGSHFGPYELIKRVALGGMAEIHLAKANGIGGFEKLLALKVIHPKFSEDQDFIDMLIDEAKIAVQLSHVNIAQIFDLGRVEDTYFIAMEFIDGKDLYQLLVKCSELGIEIPFDIIAFIAIETAAGLQYAHTKSDNYGRDLNLIHRDISPQNVLISYDGEVKIVDFGIAKASQRSKETESGVIKGKFFYMSPEQAWGDPIDGRTDIFSTSICLYEMITGEMLYNEDRALALLEKVRKAEIPPMRRKRPDLPPALEQIVLKGLARDVNDRYQSAGALQGALSGFLYSNWPSFRRKRVADFMREVFGDQRFVLPMPAPQKKAPKIRREETSSGVMMAAGDFDPAAGKSVIFDLRNAGAAASQPTGPVSALVDDFEDEDRTVAASVRLPDFARPAAPTVDPYDYDDDDDEADERTITEAMWAQNSPPGIDESVDDETAVIDMAAVKAAANASGALFGVPGAATPMPQRRSPSLAAHSPTPPGRPPANLPDTVPQTPPARQPTPPTRRPTPPAPRPAPQDLRTPPVRSARPTLHVARRQPSAASKLFGPLGIVLLIVIGGLGYLGITFVPKLLAEPAPVTGVLVIDSQPAGATVIFDGKEYEELTPVSFPGIAPGSTHEFTLKRAGYLDKSATVNVPKAAFQAGASEKRRLLLDRAPGVLEINSKPEGADVFMDGQFIGKTPLVKEGINRDKRSTTLRFQLEDHRDRNKAVLWRDDVTRKSVMVPLSKRGQ